MLDFVSDKEIYRKVICEMVPAAKRFVWIGTSDLKDMYVEMNGKMVPFLKELDALIQRKVLVRLLHAKEPGENFRKDFDKFPMLWKYMERACCPRVHFKCIVVDGRIVYTGSANITGAGIGAKSDNRRNFESGIITDEPRLVEKVMQQFDEVWLGKHCATCGRKEFCGDRIDKM